MRIKLLILAALCALSTNAQEKALTKSEADEALNGIYNQWKEAERTRLQPNLERGYIAHGTDTLKLARSLFGAEPADGRSLWISMHGGGGCPKEVNDEQWYNQTLLYKPSEGYYVCPRAPWDAWNMWFQEPIDSLYDELIRTMVVCANVNPNKVYIMGYSAGGDGVWRLAPRMADHWAAASMMAGHPGDVSLLNVRNLPFTIWVGGDDDAYDRNKLVPLRGKELDSLRTADRGGYIHETHVLAGLPHWMNQKDTVAVSWMAKFVRNPHPDRIVWRQEEVVRPSFYWIQVPRSEMKRGNTVIASIKGNDVYVSTNDYRHLTVYLSDDMVDLDKPVTVYVNNKKVMSKQITRSASLLRETLKQRGDRNFAFPSKIEIDVK